MTQQVRELDVRPLPPAQRHRRIFELFDSMQEGDSFTLINDHDPRPLYYQFRMERAGRFGWMPLTDGPTDWRVEIARYKPKDSEAEIGSYFGRDHDEIDVIFGYLRHDLDAAAGMPGVPLDSITSLFRDFTERLGRHIRWEEEILFPAIERKAPQLALGPGRVMRMEHEEIHRFIAAVKKLLEVSPAPASSDLEQAGEILQQLHYLLSEHNHKEEGVYYPMSDEMFLPKEAAELLKQVRAMA